MLTCPLNFGIYIVKLGTAWVCIIFHTLALKHRLLNEAFLTCTENPCFGQQKKTKTFSSENCHIYSHENRSRLHIRHVYVMLRILIFN